MQQSEFTVGGNHYRVGVINAITQNNVARKLAPALIALGNLREQAGEKPDDVSLARAFCALASSIPNEDMNYAINTCLGCLSRAMPNDSGWSQVIAPNGQVMYNDISLEDLNILVIKVLDAFKIIDFFVERPSEALPDRRPKKVIG